MENKLSYKLILSGEGGVGKSVYINKFLSGKFTNQYIPTLVVQVTSLTVSGLTFNVWDTAA